VRVQLPLDYPAVLSRSDPAYLLRVNTAMSLLAAMSGSPVFSHSCRRAMRRSSSATAEWRVALRCLSLRTFLGVVDHLVNNVWR
jgi:hypothetical protein